MSTKIHATVDAQSFPSGLLLTAGQANDLEGSDVLLKDTLGQAVIADKAYDAQQRVIGRARPSRFHRAAMTSTCTRLAT